MNDVLEEYLEALKCSGLLPCLSRIVVGYLREPPRPYVFRPLSWTPVERDDRSAGFGDFGTDLTTLPGLSIM